MKAYVVASGTIFAAIVIAHVLRAIQEGPQLARNPSFIVITLVAAGLASWAGIVIQGARIARDSSSDPSGQ